MTYNPFLFSKSYQERLDDFNCILNNNMKASDIAKGWSDYLELVMEPVGWRAIWRMSRNLCADYKINFPCTVIVIVEHVNFKELSCLVDVSEVDDDSIHLPEKLTDVPLIELYPTKEQDASCALAMLDTASLIESLRFFYHNLWMPWDLEYDEDVSWIDAHLKGRLQLHFSVLEFQVPEEIVDKVRRLVAEGRQTLVRMEDLIETNEESELPPDHLLELTELHNRLIELRNEYIIYEKPHLLKALLERQQSGKDSKPTTTLVMSLTTADRLRNIANLLPATTEAQLVPTLQEALVKTPQQGSVYLNEGEHFFQNLAGLKTGGMLTGLESGVVVIGEVSGEECATLDLLKGCLTINRLTLRMTSSWIIMKVRPGAEMNIGEVKLHGSSITDGVDVHPGSKLSAVGCVFDNCQTALVCYPNSTVSLTRCTFTNNSIAIELREGCTFSMTDCTISGSSVCGVKVLKSSSSIKESNQLPPLNSINNVPQLRETGTVCTNNASNIIFLQNTTENVCNGDFVHRDRKTVEAPF